MKKPMHKEYAATGKPPKGTIKKGSVKKMKSGGMAKRGYGAARKGC